VLLQVVFERMESDLHIVIESNDDLTHDHHKVSDHTGYLATEQQALRLQVQVDLAGFNAASCCVSCFAAAVSVAGIVTDLYFTFTF
jgi:hypothetical protein